MTKRQQAAQVRQDQSFKGRPFHAEVILWSVRWYLMFPISYRDLELMLLDRGVAWLGFGGFWTARRTLAGYKVMAMIRKGQLRNIGDSDIRAQAEFIAGLFQMAA